MRELEDSSDKEAIKEIDRDIMEQIDEVRDTKRVRQLLL